MGIVWDAVEGEDRERLAHWARHNFETFATVVELASHATAVLNNARLAAEAACHFLLVSGQGRVAKGAQTGELVQEVRKASKELKEIDDKLVLILSQLVAVGNFGSHFEPTRDYGEENLAVARAQTKGLRKWLEERYPMMGREDSAPTSVSGLRFAMIRLTPDCLWIPTDRLHKVPFPFRAGFHEMRSGDIKENGVDAGPRTKDPVFDLVVQNLAELPTVIHRLGLRPTRLWTVFKGLPSATVLKPIGRYVFTVKPFEEGVDQWFDLPDPVEVQGRATFRFEVQWAMFREAMPTNESLMQMLVESTEGKSVSDALYLGVY
jgi:hypothetical protein